MTAAITTGTRLLFGADDFPLDVFLIVRSSACGAQAIHVILDIVVTELAYLETASQSSFERGPPTGSRTAHLGAVGRLKVTVVIKDVLDIHMDMVESFCQRGRIPRHTTG